MIELFTANTPNGIKVPIALEELGIAYTLRKMPMGSPDYRTAEFLQINPNAKIPAIRHHDGAQTPVTIFESGAILLYLAETFGGLLGSIALSLVGQAWPTGATEDAIVPVVNRN